MYIVVGSGGTGGWLLQGLARVLNSHKPGSLLLVVDGDEYEDKNVDRQHFLNLGNKAEVKVEETSKFFPNISMLAEPKWVVEECEPGHPSAITPYQLMAEGDVVFCVVDNHATQKLILDAAQEYNNIDVFTGGNDEGLFGSMFHYQRRDGENITDHPSEWHDEFIEPGDRNPGELSCEERAKIDGGSQTVAANMLVASTILARYTKTLLLEEEDDAAEIMFDLSVGLMQPYDRRD